MYYFTADVHFGDVSTFKNERRPFKNVTACDKYIVKTWNKVAKKNDTIFCVGDLLDCNDENSTVWRNIVPKWVKKIKAKIVLIMGNNEERIVKYFFNNNFSNFKIWAKSIGIDDVVKDLKLTHNGKKYYLNHYPHKHKDGYINIFGHVHGEGGLRRSYGINAGVDVNFFRLFTFEDFDFLIERSIRYDYDHDPDMNSWF